jgi:hypothetical protein
MVYDAYWSFYGHDSNRITSKYHTRLAILTWILPIIEWVCFRRHVKTIDMTTDHWTSGRVALVFVCVIPMVIIGTLFVLATIALVSFIVNPASPETEQWFGWLTFHGLLSEFLYIALIMIHWALMIMFHPPAKPLNTTEPLLEKDIDLHV